MTFKDQLALDNASVFMDVDEFADDIVLDGRPLTVNMEDMSFAELGIDMPGVYGHAKILYVTTVDLQGAEYVPEQVVQLNGSHWTIKDVRDEYGMMVFELLQYTS